VTATMSVQCLAGPFFTPFLRLLALEGSVSLRSNWPFRPASHDERVIAEGDPLSPIACRCEFLFPSSPRDIRIFLYGYSEPE
jgi:hypothetical protein